MSKVMHSLDILYGRGKAADTRQHLAEIRHELVVLRDQLEVAETALRFFTGVPVADAALAKIAEMR
jgi:outer membrane protein TolC